MKTAFALWVLIALLHVTTAPAAQNVPASQPAGRGGELAALEQKVLGTWEGPACGGDYTFNPDGTFVCTNLTPGGYTLTGTWSLRWDALPPTLVLTSKTSDFRKKDPSGEEYEYLGKALELKVLELNGDTLVFRPPDARWEWRGSRPEEKSPSPPASAPPDHRS